MLRELPAFLGVLTFLSFPATLAGAYQHFVFLQMKLLRLHKFSLASHSRRALPNCSSLCDSLSLGLYPRIYGEQKEDRFQHARSRHEVVAWNKLCSVVFTHDISFLTILSFFL